MAGWLDGWMAGWLDNTNETNTEKCQKRLLNLGIFMTIFTLNHSMSFKNQDPHV
ncbi:hypothetical protein MXM08_19335 [Aeromonas sanarellii]|uniref:hypothetical protein n=1 Tax=Aeromonas sanarellii TaxID=633415 RepID=UPI002DBBF36B|nr:hypothetical protein [Aeromonas sanarellii]MEB6608682.1 hypothetical protein [Aeromonas sanarellii]